MREFAGPCTGPLEVEGRAGFRTNVCGIERRADDDVAALVEQGDGAVGGQPNAVKERQEVAHPDDTDDDAGKASIGFADAPTEADRPLVCVQTALKRPADE